MEIGYLEDPIVDELIRQIVDLLIELNKPIVERVPPRAPEEPRSAQEQIRGQEVQFELREEPDPVTSKARDLEHALSFESPGEQGLRDPVSQEWDRGLDGHARTLIDTKRSFDTAHARAPLRRLLLSA